ncbi:recombinase RecT [Streptomyces luteolus]|uniref:Recombinase RecT n=1 Tax=Streptomyces luteolus TaxID=3043615 RepID=A0ABT6SQW8_9ACTN|nr:recombinase RecT [Streptomyces sp. B-S-A12]MDI3417996.1 recombinase RecT [Streptomyces sp. B-S-A12]
MTGGDMAEPPVTWLAIRDDQKAFEEQQLRALRAAFPDLAEAAPAQLGIFFHYCKASGLDPFGRQIYMIKRRSRGEVRWTIQTGIDGYRLIARRAADRAGQPLAYEDFVWYDAEGGEHTVWLRDESPAACRVVLWRGDSRFPAVAHWREYAPKVWDYESQDYKIGGLWPQMPASQLSKVAEALALRRACPADLSGLHVDEEMHAADAAETRERVEAAASRLRRSNTPAPADSSRHFTKEPQTGQQDAQEADVVDAVVVDQPAAQSTQHEAPEGRPDATVETAAADAADRPAMDPYPLPLARQEVEHTADILGITFGEVNDICFELNDMSYQDAGAEQLNDLARLLAGSDEHPGSPQMAARIAAFREQRDQESKESEPGQRATRRAAAKKASATKRPATKASSRPAATAAASKSDGRRTTAPKAPARKKS